MLLFCLIIGLNTFIGREESIFVVGIFASLLLGVYVETHTKVYLHESICTFVVGTTRPFTPSITSCCLDYSRKLITHHGSVVLPHFILTRSLMFYCLYIPSKESLGTSRYLETALGQWGRDVTMRWNFNNVR